MKRTREIMKQTRGIVRDRHEALLRDTNAVDLRSPPSNVYRALGTFQYCTTYCRTVHERARVRSSCVLSPERINTRYMCVRTDILITN